MLFNSYVFVFLFFPLCLGGYYIAVKKGRTSAPKLFLTAMSLWFYGWFNALYIPILLMSMAVNYGVYLCMRNSSRKRLWLAAGLAFNLSALFFFKYFNYFLELSGGTLKRQLPVWTIILPLGISFFTFEQISFLMEAYRGSISKIKILDYSFFISFFPKLIQGPIALPQEIFKQIEFKGKNKFDWESLYRGLNLFILGLFKKVLIADTFGKAVDLGYGSLSALNSGDAVLVMLFYTLQLYFDFSGYCDMAMGIAQMLFMELPLNFDSPYKASSIIEFWKRWHITLNRFFTKYLYIPMGGNRKGKLRTYCNYLIVFLISGVWHGAGLQFLVWGLMHGFLYVLTKLWQEHRTKKSFLKTNEKGSHLNKLKQAVCTVGTFMYVNIAWVFFRAGSVGEALDLLKTICRLDFGKMNWNLAGVFNLDEFWYVIKVLHLDRFSFSHYILMILIVSAVLLLVFAGKTAVNYTKNVKPSILNSMLMAGLFVWGVLAFSQVSTFLYFNF